MHEPEQCVYGGVQTDLDVAAAFAQSPLEFRATKDSTIMEKAVGSPVASAVYLPCAAGVLALDLPLSFVADTLTLPITVPAAIDRAIAGYSFPHRPPAPPDGIGAGAGVLHQADPEGLAPVQHDVSDAPRQD